MKRAITFFAVLLLAGHAAMLSAQDTKSDYKFEITGTDYYSTGMFATPYVGEVSFGYRINKSFGVSVSGLATNLKRQDKSWGAMAGVSAYPRLCEKFSMIPSLEIGTVGGMLDGQKEKVLLACGLGLEARYSVYRDLQCGFVSKCMAAKGHETFMFGITLILLL